MAEDRAAAGVRVQADVERGCSRRDLARRPTSAREHRANRRPAPASGGAGMRPEVVTACQSTRLQPAKDRLIAILRMRPPRSRARAHRPIRERQRSPGGRSQLPVERDDPGSRFEFAAELRPKGQVHVRPQEQRDHGGCADVRVEEIPCDEADAGDSLSSSELPRLVRAPGIDVVAYAAGALALRRRDEDAPIARAEVTDDVPGVDGCQIEHRRHDGPGARLKWNLDHLTSWAPWMRGERRAPAGHRTIRGLDYGRPGCRRSSSGTTRPTRPVDVVD